MESGFLRPILKKSYPHFKVFFHILNFFLKNLIYNIASIAKASKLKSKSNKQKAYKQISKKQLSKSLKANKQISKSKAMQS